MKLSREEAWAGTLESMVDNRVVFYLRRYNRDYQDYSRQMKELCEKYPAIIQLIDGNNGVTLNDEEYQVFKTYSELSSNREMLERAYYYYFGQADMFHYQKLLKEISETKEREPEQRKKEILECMRQFRLEEAEKEFRFDPKARRLTPSYIRFMNWGIMWNGKCLTARISESLSPEKECILSDILMKDVPEKYYLSPEQTRRLLFKSSQAAKGAEFIPKTD